MKVRTEISRFAGSTPLSHYTDAVRFGELLFISGTVALDENNQVVAPGDVVAQADYVLAAIGQILEQASGDFNNIIRMTVYLVDINDRNKINPVRRKYFGATKPASTLFQVSALAVPGLLIEIEVVAGLDD